SPARFRSIRTLVSRVMEPVVGNYFRNSAQNYDVIEFLENRSERQREAVEHIRAALNEYGVQAFGVFINTIDLPDEIEKILQDSRFTDMEREILASHRSRQEERDRLMERRLHEIQTEAERLSLESKAKAIQLTLRAEPEVLRKRELAEVEVPREIV